MLTPGFIIPNVIAALVQKSLVEPEPRSDGMDRYRLLEVIQEFTADPLAKSGDAPVVQLAQAVYFLIIAEGFSRVSVAAMDAVPVLEQVESEPPNIRAAFGWFTQERDAEAIVRLSGSLNWLRPLQQHIHEGLLRLEQALSMPGPVAPPVRVRVMMALGLLVYLLGDDQRTEQISMDAPALATSPDGQIAATRAVTSLGALAVHRRDHDLRTRLSEQALTLCATILVPHIATLRPG